jgi:peptidyl-prolyl cis-trans isomerase C
VIKLEETRPTKLPALEEVKGQVTESLQQKKLATYRDELMKKAKVQ